MPGKLTSEIRVGANGTIYVAPVGTVAPADHAAAWGAGWVDLGYANEDGVRFRDSKTIEEISVWQLMYAARRIVTGRAAMVSFALRQWSKTTIPLAFGGGVVSVAGTGNKYDPPAPEVIDERALGVEWLDGSTLKYRLIIPKGMVVDEVETQLFRANNAELPLTFAVNGSDSASPWYLLTNDPSFA